MKNKTFRVLSIDFDYFQNASKEALMKYPDGFDLQPSLSQQVWKGKYDFKPSADLIKTETKHLKCDEKTLRKYLGVFCFFSKTSYYLCEQI